tara:strand:- start:1829 stop:2488 length:660 start_codon:yes stop_codon:yes gene_type:complete
MQRQILYSFRRCPYAIRARWALKVCDLKVELREIDLKNKPLDFLNKSKTRTVPLLILSNGDVIEESIDIIFWALSKSKKHKVKYFKNEHKKRIINLIEENDQDFKFHLDRFKYFSRFKGNDKETHYRKAHEIIIKWNNLINESKYQYLIDDQESVADWCLWPFVRQYKIASISQKKTNFFEPPIEKWLGKFEKHNYFKEVMHKYSKWENCSKSNYFPIN